MRLTAEQVRAALLHPTERVRRLAFDYFTNSYSRDTADTDAILAAIRRHGPDQFLRYQNRFAHLRHTDESIRWVIDFIPRVFQDVELGHIASVRRELFEALEECEYDLFARHESAVFALPFVDNERTTMEQRREFHGLPADALWDRLGAVCDGLNELDDPWSAVERGEAERLVRAAADHPELADRVLERVRTPADEFDFRDVFAVRLAGRMRLDAAAPLVEFLFGCEEGWEEDLEPALIRIGSDEVVRALRERWDEADWNYRFTAAVVFESIHTDASVATALELAARDRDPYGQEGYAGRLLEAAVRNLDPAAVEPTRQFLLKAPHSHQSRMLFESDLRGHLVTACELMDVRFPEYEAWRRGDIERAAAATRRLAGIDPLLPLPDFMTADSKPGPPRDTVVGKAVAGRNDPCPCGSGRKYKKCCGK